MQLQTRSHQAKVWCAWQVPDVSYIAKESLLLWVLQWGLSLFFLPFLSLETLCVCNYNLQFSFYIRGSIVYQALQNGSNVCLRCTLPLKKLAGTKSTIQVQDETWWDGQHDRCKVQSHYTPNKGWQMKPICMHLFHSPTTSAAGCKDYPRLCHDWFSWFSPSSNKWIRGQSLHHHCIIKNSEIVRYAKTFMSRSFFISAVCSYVCSLHPLSLNLLIQGQARCDSHLWWRKKTPGHYVEVRSLLPWFPQLVLRCCYSDL